MYLVTIDIESLAIRAKEQMKPHGAKRRCLLATGIANATFYRFLEGQCDNINVILSICAYFGWDVNQFKQNRDERRKDWIIV